MSLRAVVTTVSALALLAGAGCRRSSPGGAASGSALTVAGSTSVQPFVEKWAEVWGSRQAGWVVNVQGGGSTAGIRAAQSGTAQVGTVSRELKPEEQGLTPIVVARDGIAVIVHRDNPVTDLTLEQVKGIFTGAIKRWSELGGADKPITVITREEGSGTRGAFEELALSQQPIASSALVQDSTGAVREMVHRDGSAIGYISIGLVNQQVRALKISGVVADEAAVVAGTYRLVRPFLFVVKGTPSGATKEFLDFVLSPEGQELVRREGLIPAK